MHDALATPTPAPVRARRSQRSRPPQSDEPLRVLPRRLGRYTLFAHIGRGGMADIYLAQADTGLGGSRLVVIKEVLPKLAHSDGFAEMLVSEAKLAAQLSHANVAKVEDLGRAGDSLYIAMEYVEGLDLREMLRRCAKSKVALPVEFSLRIVIEALRGLSFAHRARGNDGRPLGIVHRDVSPSNVLLSFEGEVKVCDFGIARANPLAEEIQEDTILGKAGYMSPEQARGETLDARADVFAMGIILWELIAGRRLYKIGDGERPLEVARAARIPELPSRDLPREEELYAIVRRALTVDREARYKSAAAMLQDLEDYAAATRMIASPIRFGEWLMDQFGHEVVLDRRARERVVRALARGPAAVIQPLGTQPEVENTPSAFPVALRADADDVEEPAPSSTSDAREIADVAHARAVEAPPRVIVPVAREVAPVDEGMDAIEKPVMPVKAIAAAKPALVRAPSAPIAAPKAAGFQGRFLVAALVLAAVAYLAMRMFVV
ncbi:Serine/threonine kinase PKN11 [Minicystis rosea]|nr:Serine/threonine kinase PKN11 [Minicystis rosea]